MSTAGGFVCISINRAQGVCGVGLSDPYFFYNFSSQTSLQPYGLKKTVLTLVRRLLLVQSFFPYKQKEFRRLKYKQYEFYVKIFEV